MNNGMLWFNNDTNLDLYLKVSQAANYFWEKYGSKPNCCYVHPSMLDGKLMEGCKEPLTVEDIELRPLNDVRPNHFWMTCNGKVPM